jgi:hypothetical protein
MKSSVRFLWVSLRGALRVAVAACVLCAFTVPAAHAEKNFAPRSRNGRIRRCGSQQ